MDAHLPQPGGGVVRGRREADGFDGCEHNAHVMAAVVHRLEQLVAAGDAAPPGLITRFDARSRPVITIPQYLERICKYAPCSNHCYTMSLLYMERLTALNPHVVVTSANIHRFFITSLLVAIKVFDDAFYQNVYMARVGGLKVQELNNLEQDFLSYLHFELSADPASVAAYWAQQLRPLVTCTDACGRDPLLLGLPPPLRAAPTPVTAPAAAAMEVDVVPSTALAAPVTPKTPPRPAVTWAGGGVAASVPVPASPTRHGGWVARPGPSYRTASSTSTSLTPVGSS